MKKHNLKDKLNSIYSSFPEAQEKPVVGITANYADSDAKLTNRYYKMVVKAGGVPVIIPPIADKEMIINTLENIEALLLSGGGDINPLWTGEQPSTNLHGINAERDEAELLTTILAFNRQIPILGICRGIQTLATALGGSVIQDIKETGKQKVKHSQDAARYEETHTVSIQPGTLLSKIFSEAEDGGTDETLLNEGETEEGKITEAKLSNGKAEEGKAAEAISGNGDAAERGNNLIIEVNSFHHQAVGDPGKFLTVCARSEDGFIEAVESNEYKPILAVQWHPEWLDSHLPLFQWLVKEASLFKRVKKIHDRVITLDTHCDTPMFFSQGIDFGKREEKILVDLHKMTDGRLDATTMVAYLPQPKEGEKFDNIAPFRAGGPKAYADLIYDKIEEIVNRYGDYIALARTPEELAANKRAGKKSIMRGIENGLAIEDNLDNINHFAKRGCVYITLCHNGDNDICDSAKRSLNTHGGVSPFGEKVIQRMNEQGLMVDLSHANEKSFYDALEISKTPVVCSHSNSRALCDVTRNLTDDQLKALAKRGGVAHITLYEGFVKAQGKATILDAMQHLDHAIKIMGIEHVGLGTDFDGDGCVIGLENASELTNFTRQLLLRKYSEEEIAMIWGGNWLRLMQEIQAAKR